MNTSGLDLKILRARMTGLGERLDGAWAEKLGAQLHLDQGTPECAYWHSGYHQALADVLRLLTKPGIISDSAGTSSQIPVAG